MTRPITAAAIVLGLALGGMFDAIVIHLILQWHHVASAMIDATTLEGLRANLVWDGVFLATMWLVALAGTAFLWRRAPREPRALPGRQLVGAMLIGWGLFHLFDSVVTHSLLGLHHVHPDQPLLSDLAFLLSGVVLLGLGWWFLRSAGIRPRMDT